MKMIVISGNYPSPQAPQVGTFVYQVVQQFIKLGVEVFVISPQVYFKRKGGDVSYGNELATVYRPKTFSFSNKQIWFINSSLLTQFFQALAIRKAMRKLQGQAHVIYCHFVISALNYYCAFPDSNLLVFIAVGEYHNIDVVRKNYSSQYYSKFLNRIAGFIAVSPQVKEKLISLGVPKAKILMEPNGVDRSVFKRLNKQACRKKFGLPQRKKIVLFVGRLIESKGPLRVLEAINRLPDDVVGVFVGKGPQVVDGGKVVFNGVLPHHEMAQMMSAADVFVLPTLHEGSSNVIVEAMSCGLPIVTSDLPEVRVQCDPSFSILVNPLDIGKIQAAIKHILFDLTILAKYSEAARAHSEKFDLEQRTRRILHFINSKASSRLQD